MTIETFNRLRPYISVQKIAQKAGLSGHALRARGRRGTALTDEQRTRFVEALREIGLELREDLRTEVEAKEIVDTTQSAAQDVKA